MANTIKDGLSAVIVGVFGIVIFFVIITTLGQLADYLQEQVNPRRQWEGLWSRGEYSRIWYFNRDGTWECKLKDEIDPRRGTYSVTKDAFVLTCSYGAVTYVVKGTWELIANKLVLYIDEAPDGTSYFNYDALVLSKHNPFIPPLEFEYEPIEKATPEND